MTKLEIGSPEWVERLTDTAVEVGALLTKMSHEDRTTPIATVVVLRAIAEGIAKGAPESAPRDAIDRWVRNVHVGIDWKVEDGEGASLRKKAALVAPVPRDGRYAVVFFREVVERSAGIELRRGEAYGKDGIPWAWLFDDEEKAREHARAGAPPGGFGRVFREADP